MHDSDCEPKGIPVGIEPISRLVEREAKRVLTERQLRADPALVAQGWKRRFVADLRRADEAMESYRQLGYEVRAESVTPDQVGDDCGDCQLVRIQFRMIYTKIPRATTAQPAENQDEHTE